MKNNGYLIKATEIQSKINSVNKEIENLNLSSKFLNLNLFLSF